LLETQCGSFRRAQREYPAGRNTGTDDNGYTPGTYLLNGFKHCAGNAAKTETRNHQSLDRAVTEERADQKAVGTGITRHDIDTCELRLWLQGESLTPQRSSIKTDLFLINHSKSAELQAAEGLHLARVRFGNVPGGVYLSVHHYHSSLAD